MAEGPDPGQSLSKSPATPTLKDLSNALDSVVDWHSLGVKLGLEDHELSKIDKNFHGERCKHEMLSRWLRNAKLNTWKAVADALQQMGEYKVALKILNDHCISSNTTDTRTSLATTPQDPSAAVAQHNIIMIRGKFAMLVTKSRKRLQNREIDVEDIQTFLVTMYSSPNSRDGSGMVMIILEAAKSLDEIFRALGNYGLWNYLNYSLLQSIIREFAHDDKELNDMMEQYQQDLAGHILALRIQTFLEATHFNHPIATSNSDSLVDEVIPLRQKHRLFKKLTAKCEVNVTDHTLSYVIDLWQSLVKQFALPRPAMILHEVAKGCIGITWLIPANLVKYVTRMAQESANMFAEENVLKVTLEEQCIYSMETKLATKLVTEATPLDSEPTPLDSEPTPLDSEPPGLETAALKGGGGDRGLDLPGERSLLASVMSLDLVRKGKNCIQAAKAAYDAVTHQDPNLHQVIVNLESLLGDGKNLATYSQEAKRKAEATEQQLQAEMKGLNTEKQQIEANITKLRQDQANAERRLAQQKATLNDEVNSVGQMERDLSNAEQRLHRAKRKQKRKKRRFKLFGAAAGLLTGGVGGALLGGLFGASIAGLAASDQIPRAKAEIARRKAEISSTKTNITATQQTIATIREQVVKLEANITGNRKKADQLHASIGTCNQKVHSVSTKGCSFMGCVHKSCCRCYRAY